ncbi:MAG: hypothetical protein E4G96_02020 [Chrysiogenales bacterium]|nr:MAG: hypothetical protein E4G96_02020 [Chrysiogenales bacterium]
MSEPNCPNCTFRKRYDSKPASLLGRLWRWHINWCPGWKSYISGLPEEERESLRSKYGLK